MQIIVSFQLSLEDGKRYMNRKFQKFLISTTAKMNLLYEQIIKFIALNSSISFIRHHFYKTNLTYWELVEVTCDQASKDLDGILCRQKFIWSAPMSYTSTLMIMGQMGVKAPSVYIDHPASSSDPKQIYSPHLNPKTCI